MSNTVHADLNRSFYPDRFVASDQRAAHHDRMAAHLLGHLTILDTAAQDAPALFAPPSALALYIGPLLRWAALYPVSAKRWLDLERFPALKALTHALEARASTWRAAAAEGLGATPFSDPKHPNPPIGSAT